MIVLLSALSALPILARYLTSRPVTELDRSLIRAGAR